MLLLDAAKLYETLADVRRLNNDAKKDYAKTDYYEDLFLVWTEKLKQYIEPFIPEKERQDTAQRALATIEEICSGFASVAKVLGSRRRNRTPFEVKDEYDVQDILEALLRVHFDDVRPEEPNPTISGQSSRVDFFLKRER